MSEHPELAGWAWFEGAAATSDGAELELCRAFARALSGADGERVMTHLRRIMLDRRLPPSASDAELRHLEGQRYAIAYVAGLVERGRN